MSSLTKIRRYVRDPNGVIFSEAEVLRAYNRARKRLFVESELRVRGTVLPIPPLKNYACCFRWEREFAADNSIWEPLFSDVVNGYQCCQLWEVSLTLGLSSLPSGGDTGLCPADAFFTSIQNELVYQLPQDCFKVILGAWKGSRIEQRTKASLLKEDPFFHTRRGDVVLYFCMLDPIVRSFVPYPQPSTRTITENLGGSEGPPIYADDGALDWTGEGPIVGISGVDPEDSSDGLVMEINFVKDGFTFFFVVVPLDLESFSEEEILPRPFVKYAEFLAASNLLLMDGELQNMKKAQILLERYKNGLRLIEDAKRKLRWDVSAHMRGIHEGQTVLKGRQRVRFPDHYPRVWR